MHRADPMAIGQSLSAARRSPGIASPKVGMGQGRCTTSGLGGGRSGTSSDGQIALPDPPSTGELEAAAISSRCWSRSGMREQKGDWSIPWKMDVGATSTAR